MTAFVLLTDAYGALGGIAKYNRDLLDAMSTFPGMGLITVLPRIAASPCEQPPPGVDFRTEAAGGKGRYLAVLAQSMRRVRSSDFVLCGHINLLPAAYLAACRYRCPLYLLTYGLEVWAPSPSRLANSLTSRLDWIVSISDTTSERFRAWARLGGTPTEILPNAFDQSAFGTGPKAPALLARYGLADKTVLMTFGRLASRERMKGFDQVIELMPRLLKREPNLVYVVMGDGTDRTRLQDKARALGVSKQVVFTGVIAEAEKAAHYRLADLYVMPSRGEGFGFVLLEAMACGIPVIASKHDGGREAVRDGMLGILVDPSDPDDIEAGIMQGLSKPRGVVPAGLEFFSFEAFTERTHAWLGRAASARA